MNYRHSFHAGNIADVVKHAVLALVLDHLKAKDTSFRVLDSHAGAGLYDLGADQALRTGEWVEGIGRLWGKPAGSALEAMIGPYLDHVAAHNPDGRLKVYPGSPAIIRAALRANDAATLCELNPDEAAELDRTIAGDPRIKVMAGDGWTAVKALLPPKERRGLTLIDPPFEAGDDFERLVIASREAMRRFATGILMLWYPIKDRARMRAFHEALDGLAMEKQLTIETIWRPIDGTRLSGSGLVVVNPPYRLAETVQAAAPDFWAALGKPQGRMTVTGRF